MIDLIRTWPPRPITPRRKHPVQPELTIITNNIRIRHNYRVLDSYIVQAMKAGHLILRWDWTSPNKAEAACLECDLTLTVDTEAGPGHEADGSPVLEQYCE